MSRATVQLSLQSRKVWIYSSVLDLIVGCGAWSLPLMILAYLLGTKSLFVASVTFYALALFANNPHYMATIYRAYRDSEDFYRYKLFTVYITGLMLIIALLCHIAPSLFLWVFTLYVTWSPWHYAGQNFGLLMMFVRRNTDVSKTERNALYTAFLASYLILFLSFHSGTSADPNLISLGIPLAFAKIARITLLVVSLYLSFYVFWKLVRRASIASMIAPLTLISTQFIWFMLPTVLEISYGAEITQTSYSSGVLAFMHSAQYLWITSYYAKREVETEGGKEWSLRKYFLILVVGAIVLFLPAPWLISYLFHFDFSQSLLIFMAIINIHHFILDGAIWKLRDSKISGLLIGNSNVIKTVGESSSRSIKEILTYTKSLFTGSSSLARAARFALLFLLFLLAGIDQARFYLGFNEKNPTNMAKAEILNPYDATLYLRMARADRRVGDVDQTLAKLERVVMLNPHSREAQQILGQILIEKQRYADAYLHYKQMLEKITPDKDSLINFSTLASKLGKTDEAIDGWRRVLEIEPENKTVRLYLAETLFNQSKFLEAIVHYEKHIALLTEKLQERRPEPKEIIYPSLNLARCYQSVGQMEVAAKYFQLVQSIATQAGDRKAESLSLVSFADILAANGKSSEANKLYQKAIEIDLTLDDRRAEAVDWFNYGQFLRRVGATDSLALACILRAEHLLKSLSVPEVETVGRVLEQMSSEMDKDSFEEVKKDFNKKSQQALSINLPSQ